MCHHHQFPDKIFTTFDLKKSSTRPQICENNRGNKGIRMTSPIGFSSSIESSASLHQSSYRCTIFRQVVTSKIETFSSLSEMNLCWTLRILINTHLPPSPPKQRVVSSTASPTSHKTRLHHPLRTQDSHRVGRGVFPTPIHKGRNYQ